tara:strand:- start:6489 stop:7709 length:1221 start_codon:yes stop_codon:yes gene_type:complete
LNPVVEVSSLSKTYPLSKRRLKTFWNALLNKRSLQGFRALENISFSVFRGDVVGIIGLNGAGKTTLLQIISGTLLPSSGNVSKTGKLAAVLELGSGFDANFSGKENTRIYLSSLGVSKSDIEEKIQDIINFAEINEFADAPVRTYSSGMIARLAFSAAVSVDPEILILDEVFAVGDQAFARKSFKKIKEFIQQGKTVFLCSHSVYHIQMVCNKTLYLKQGKLSFFGYTKDALVKYENDLEQNPKDLENKHELDSISKEKRNSVGFRKVTLMKNDIPLVDLDDQSRVFQSGIDTFNLEFYFEYDFQKEPPKLGVVIHDMNRRPITCAGSHFDKFVYKRPHNAEKAVKVSFPKINLLKGDYEIDVFLLCENGFLLLDHWTLSPHIRITQVSNEVGLFSIDHLWHDLNV